MHKKTWFVAAASALIVGCFGGSSNGAGGPAAGKGASGGSSASGSGGSAGVGGTGGSGGSGGSGSCAGTNVCTADYPCQNLAPDYTCRGQFDDWPPAYSASAFTVNGNGTVTDSRSGLLWQQAVDANSYTWAAAKTYCAGLSLAGTGWRLPSRAELLTLVDRTKRNPAIDPTAFPSTPATYFWSSSPYVGSSGDAWLVDFGYGSSVSNGSVAANTVRVRCVR